MYGGYWREHFSELSSLRNTKIVEFFLSQSDVYLVAGMG